MNIPVHCINAENAPGTKLGGTLNVVVHMVELLVPGDRIPDGITVDVGGLGLNESLHLSDIKLPEGCQPFSRGRDLTIATLVPPTTLTEAEVNAEAAAAAAASAKAAAAAPPK